MRKRIISLVCLLAVGVIVARPPEFIRILERQGLAKLVADGRLDLARWAAWGMSLQNDAIGSSNYHALAFHHAVPAGGKVRKSVSRAADRAWREMGKRGVGAAYWNLAMFNVKYGRKRTRSDRNTTGWLKWAARTGVPEAQQLLAAGDGEFDRIELLMEMGDPGAMATYASSLNTVETQDAYIKALRRAAEAGHVASMTRLGLALSRRSVNDPEILPWLERAARAGQTTAASRVGACYAKGEVFCGGKSDLVAAEQWYTLAVGPHVHFQPPRLVVDDRYAIRIGTTARWYVKPHNVRKNAQQELARIRGLLAAQKQAS